ncbi:hypothetical protein [Streptomyces botrytidirepellens]|uniref:Uncharacterized protein n=1 Tax=Streptomyces botrytidirepellens TaxID=2486417 RepID=A0A3M8XAJ8_9ACTN|nr:hypothetical protein [Streptomyces botrytidirepellens]RNG38180.1 hypothetical protein EEJ42_01495 [Streptomyces botrytidirepellens]
MPDSNHQATPSRRAALFDLRILIAALFAVYGTVLTVMGAAGASNEDLEKAGGWNVNLWSGIAMLAVTAAFGSWALLRPVRIPPSAEQEPTPDEEQPQPV